MPTAVTGHTSTFLSVSQLPGWRPKTAAQVATGVRGGGVQGAGGRGTYLRDRLHRQLHGRAGAGDPEPGGWWWVGGGRQERRGLDRQVLRGRHHHGGQGAGELRQLGDRRRQHFGQRWGEDGGWHGCRGDLGGDIHSVWRRVAKQDLGAQGTGKPVGVPAMPLPRGGGGGCPGPKQVLPGPGRRTHSGLGDGRSSAIWPPAPGHVNTHI